MNRTPAKGSKPHGNDCRFANECEEKNLCCNFDCKRKCVWCFDFNCRELCSKYDNSPCSVLQKPPYVCNVCSRRRNCKCDRFYYMANQADAMSKKRYSKARKKTHADKDELKRIDSIVYPLIRKGQPISHIYAEHGDEIGVSPRTLYRYIDMGCLKVNNFDLRRKVSYKQRKKKREESEAFQNQKFRQTRTYLDFVKYMEKHPDVNVVEMDTVKGCREQGKRMLTLLFRKDMIERYKERTGHYPERVLVDKIYRTRENLKYCKQHKIRLAVLVTFEGIFGIVASRNPAKATPFLVTTSIAFILCAIAIAKKHRRRSDPNVYKRSGQAEPDADRDHRRDCPHGWSRLHDPLRLQKGR